MGLEFESPAGHQKHHENKRFSWCFSYIFELFRYVIFVTSDLADNLLTTATLTLN